MGHSTDPVESHLHCPHVEKLILLWSLDTGHWRQHGMSYDEDFHGPPRSSGPQTTAQIALIIISTPHPPAPPSTPHCSLLHSQLEHVILYTTITLYIVIEGTVS